MIEADKADPESLHQYTPWSCGSNRFSKRTVDVGPAKQFRDSSPSSIESLQAAFIDLSLLILYNGLLFILILLRFSHQDVTPAPGA
jgi:hypothetical protein